MDFIDKNTIIKKLILPGIHQKKLRQLVRIPIILAAAFIFCENSFAQRISKNLIHQYDVSRLESDGRLCAKWYSRFLDPDGGTYEVVEVDGTMFTIDIYPNNRYSENGGRVAMRAICEIKNGQLNSGWTSIYAQRGGWIAN